MTSPINHPAWNGYELLASGDGQRLERWNNTVILRPESAALWSWKDRSSLPAWAGCYSGDRATGGIWNWRHNLPDHSTVSYGELSFFIRPTNSKHLGLFPEQSMNWDWIRELISARKQRDKSPEVRILNLFGYTGGASIAAAAAGALVTHVDAAKAMVGWCSENACLSGLAEAPIRYIADDALTFLQREIRRGNRYDGIIMDPPSFGRGKKGELWKLSEHLPFLIDTAQEALSEQPLFLLLNTYSDTLDDIAQSMISKRLSRLGGSVETMQLSLIGTRDHQMLPCGLSHRWRGMP
ncbi:MAG: class I SAM-dependent methyltransferase [Verrucomicrobia bacterium]|nr:class I SAM-dependent methyltransferase [Verrucomicrobiota bacterium]